MSEDSFKHETSAPATPILSAPYRTDERWLFRTRIRLYVDRLELSGWRWWRRVQRDIPLNRISRVKALGETTLRVRPRDRDALFLQIKNAERWARAIRSFRACLDETDARSGE